MCCCCCSQVASVMSDSVRPHRQQPTRLPCPWDFPGKNAGVGCHFLLQCVKVKLLSRVQLLVTPWIVAHQAPLSMRFSKQGYWMNCHAFLQDILPTRGLNLCFPWLLSHRWSQFCLCCCCCCC